MISKLNDDFQKLNHSTSFHYAHLLQPVFHINEVVKMLRDDNKISDFWNISTKLYYETSNETVMDQNTKYTKMWELILQALPAVLMGHSIGLLLQYTYYYLDQKCR